MLIGYMRVSTTDQTHHLQRDALQASGCQRFYEDTCSGMTRERPGLSRALDAVRTDVNAGVKMHRCAGVKMHQT